MIADLLLFDGYLTGGAFSFPWTTRMLRKSLMFNKNSSWILFDGYLTGSRFPHHPAMPRPNDPERYEVNDTEKRDMISLI